LTRNFHYPNQNKISANHQAYIHIMLLLIFRQIHPQSDSAFAHDLNLPMTFEVTLNTENLLIEAVDAIIAGEDETLTAATIDLPWKNR
jgi:hypothetical protein